MEEATEDDQFKAVMDEAKEVSAFSSLCVLCNSFLTNSSLLLCTRKIGKFFFFIVFAPRMLASALVRGQITLRRRSLWSTITTTTLISLVLS